MKSVSANLLQVIKELQTLKCLNGFSLGGGTSLAIRYNHRISVDIDLFCSDIVGKAGFQAIAKEIAEYYTGDFFGSDFPCDIDDQYVFLRFFIRKNGEVIKVEVLQNFKMLYQPDIVNGIRLLTVKDIGLLKLMSVSNRASNKDVYDLEYLTDEVSLINLYELLKQKENSFNRETDRTIFGLDNEESPINNPTLLLKFDQGTLAQDQSRPQHSHDRIMLVDHGKPWQSARVGWRRKVRQLYSHLGIEFPGVVGFDI